MPIIDEIDKSYLKKGKKEQWKQMRAPTKFLGTFGPHLPVFTFGIVSLSDQGLEVIANCWKNSKSHNEDTALFVEKQTCLSG